MIGSFCVHPVFDCVLVLLVFLLQHVLRTFQMHKNEKKQRVFAASLEMSAMYICVYVNIGTSAMICGVKKSKKNISLFEYQVLCGSDTTVAIIAVGVSIFLVTIHAVIPTVFP